LVSPDVAGGLNLEYPSPQNGSVHSDFRLPDVAEGDLRRANTGFVDRDAVDHLLTFVRRRGGIALAEAVDQSSRRGEPRGQCEYETGEDGFAYSDIITPQ
jgi:hypothetical protein